jgi:pSer/pThr/pTyr-binding forkhead associated (FHA) protein
MGDPPSVDLNKTIMTGAPSLNRTVTIEPVKCPVCQTANPPGLIYCSECGLVFEKALDGDAFGAPAVQLPVLIDADGREHQLRPGTQSVGRQGDISVEDVRVSRRHAQIHLDGAQVFVEDLGSTNGTKVGDEPAPAGQKVEVVNKGVISLGGFVLTLSMPGEQNRTLAALGGKTSAIAAPPTTDSTRATLVCDGEEHGISLGVHSFGRRDSNDLTISNPYVSGSHGELEMTDEGLFITDKGSTNGTFINDAQLQPDQRSQVRSGDKIRFGSLDVEIRFKGE